MGSASSSSREIARPCGHQAAIRTLMTAASVTSQLTPSTFSASAICATALASTPPPPEPK